ncbi:coat protein [Maize associated totivirus]|nr:coat protein [Maize associated totivirus]
MDVFLRSVFRDSDHPGAKFVFDKRPAIHAFLDTKMTISNAKVRLGSRNLKMSQDFTPVGRAEATFVEGINMQDGINMAFLDASGLVMNPAVISLIRSDSSIDRAELRDILPRVQNWTWYENQTSLILNMLRYVFLRKIQETNGTLRSHLGVYDDGHVKIDLDKMYKNDKRYPVGKPFVNWPCGDLTRLGELNFRRLETAISTDDAEAIDLRALNRSEATFVIMMLLKWRRQSRMRLDFETPHLATKLRYRHDDELFLIDEWMAGDVEVPNLPSSKDAWATLLKYVAHNRIYSAFSTALYLFATLAYQMVPATAEGTIWLDETWNVSLPNFHATRGRLVQTNTGVAALITNRSLAEWEYFSGRFEKINLLALTWIQAVQAGLAVRATRYGIEEDPNDLFTSRDDFYRVDEFIACAASEAMRMPMPTSGQTDVYVYIYSNYDYYDADRVVVTDMTWDDNHGLHGYKVVKQDVKVTLPGYRDVKFEEVTDEMDPDYSKRANYLLWHAGAVAQIEQAKRMSTSDDVVDPQLTAEQKRAVDGVVRFFESGEHTESFIAIRVPWMVFPGVPVYIMPLKCFPHTTPFDFSGKLTSDECSLTVRKNKMDGYRAWFLAHVARLCGYDLETKIQGDLVAGSQYFAPNDRNIVWPLLFDYDEADRSVSFTGQTRRRYHWIELPVLWNFFFRNQAVKYVITPLRKGVSKAHSEEESPVLDFRDDTVNVNHDTILHFRNSKTLQTTTAWVTRDDTGFRFARIAEDGETSGLSQVPDAVRAEDPCAPRGPRQQDLLLEQPSGSSTQPQWMVIDIPRRDLSLLQAVGESSSGGRTSSATRTAMTGTSLRTSMASSQGPRSAAAVGLSLTAELIHRQTQTQDLTSSLADLSLVDRPRSSESAVGRVSEPDAPTMTTAADDLMLEQARQRLTLSPQGLLGARPTRSESARSTTPPTDRRGRSLFARFPSMIRRSMSSGSGSSGQGHTRQSGQRPPAQSSASAWSRRRGGRGSI